MATSANLIVERLVEVGFAQDFVRASLPDWWDPTDNSSSAKTLVSLLLAKRLSLDPESLLDDGVPVGFLYTGVPKFKHMRLAPGARRDVLVAFAQGVGRVVLGEMRKAPAQPIPTDPTAIRNLLLGSGRPYVSFGDVLTICWSLGIPVLHLRLFPARTKGVTAIAVRLGEQHAILVARESGSEAQYMFHVAHELGHIALGHLKGASAIVDADPKDPDNDPGELIDDEEEVAADRYAQGLLTGSENFSVDRDGLGTHGTARELAQMAIAVGATMQVDPGHVAMSFGHTTSEWSMAMAAASRVATQSEKPGTLVNRVLWSQLGRAEADAMAQSRAFLEAVAPI
ncbi:ImmA/IrrE family metallo-endopeptidase [Thiomonas sp. FB-Cd]|uniref:ImmA/IrrE family metallo-endopeptidase n=1 Tax=Thiomonas sp. FB-Cd TaxID=1158292 RepID=UPI0018CC1A70|nr:ImmA/IrrE family metallo-endopeptidase [Thiomonas sp. FB-Cd]